MMTDREVAVATFKAVAAVYYAVTGKPLTVDVETEGGTITVTDSPTRVIQAPAAASSLPV
jgi:hypothetical protein